MTIIIGQPRKRAWVNPIAQVRSQYRCAKTRMGDMVLCHCVFPHLRMREGFFGFTCENTRCRDFIAKKDLKFVERIPLDTESVMRFATRRHSSNIFNLVKKAEKTGNYMQAFEKD